MVAKITTPKRIEAALNYNEKKVQKGNAVCLQAVNYLQDAGEMSFYQKLAGFEQRNRLNERATTRTLHVSLNFDPSEKMNEEKLLQIASDYMMKIGFAEQPYLVYKHEDAGHPHIHIVSTTIKADGSRINTHNIGRNQSEKARKEIEQQYGLIKAERQQQLGSPMIKPVDVQKVIYGKSETHRGIANVVSAVFSSYKFCSLPEYNASLKQFNVVADRGKEEGRIYKNRGLVYRVLDERGSKVGVPIKASAIGCQPTLTNLEKKFAANEVAKESLKPFVKTKLEECLAKSPATVHGLIELLKKKNIYTLLRQNAEGRVYGITFVDNQNKCVFNGSDLGKGYSVASIQTRLANPSVEIAGKQIDDGERKTSGTGGKELHIEKIKEKSVEFLSSKDNLLTVLITPEQQSGNTPYSLLKKKRKKKRKNPDT
ncbi:relaxase/mobilization nuclease domain-containing protein [Lacibacter sp.]|uniref:relaxase/mobilization nuclease domain-containing protein n=1 Tax=Lacibacter sp. TaxID=1915409 RepID=UPI002B4B7FB6|nr:relaxase/mobilization nuclease domain-containing protein [Lacibacter sp.]HLP37596.1 relaxase/mobilization nuclease domain-containing protein [Lacibacter sp.]